MNCQGRSLNVRGAIIGGVALFFMGCVGDAAEHAVLDVPAVQVQSHIVQSTEQAFGTRVPGTVHSHDRATIEAKLNGRIEELKVIEGQFVKQDELLLVLDSEEMRAKLQQAIAAKEQAEKDLRRYETLLKQKVVAQQDFDAVQSKAKITAAGLNEVQTVLSYTKIQAPFAGVITRKYVSTGDLAVPGKPLLDIENPAALRFEAAVPESAIAAVAVGQHMLVHIPSANLETKGLVSELSPAADVVTRSFLVKLDLAPNNALKLGQYGTLLLPQSKQATLLIPRSAVLFRGQLEVVFVIDNGRAKLRLVRVGRQQGADVEILSGLEGNESIVRNPPKNLVDGQAITVHS